MSMDFHQTLYVHWYCEHMVWDCKWADFVNFWQSYLSVTHPNFHFWKITSVNISGFSPNLVCALMLWRSALGLLMGKFCQFLKELSSWGWSIFSFPDVNFSKCQWIFTKLDISIDIVEVWFRIAKGKISSIFEGVTCPQHVQIFVSWC